MRTPDRSYQGLLCVLASVVVGLSGCGSSAGTDASTAAPGTAATTPVAPSTQTSAPAPGPEATGPHNVADVEFATGMIRHHAQAIEMAGIVRKRTRNAEIADLATKIEAAQSPEISTMSGWLTGWGAPVPDPSVRMPDDMEMGGMMSGSDLRKLAATTTSSVDALFLTQMIEHHQGAIVMAQDELASGSNPPAKELAGSIGKSQTAEVAAMKRMLAAIG
jgi:uncharacterized protein (DUF305 family)